MINNIIIIIIGVGYAIGFVLVMNGSERFLFNILNKSIRSKPDASLLKWQTMLIILVSGVLAATFLISVLLFRHFFNDWHLFVRMFGVGFMIGLLVISFTSSITKCNT